MPCEPAQPSGRVRRSFELSFSAFGARLPRRFTQPGEKLPRLGEVRRQNLTRHLQELRDTRIFQLVEDHIALASGFYEPLPAQSGQVLRRAARVEPDFCLQIPYGALLLTDELEDANARRMPECSEEFRFQDVDGVSFERHLEG
jgi:hypothetical protein